MSLTCKLVSNIKCVTILLYESIDMAQSCFLCIYSNVFYDLMGNCILLCSLDINNTISVYLHFQGHRGYVHAHEFICLCSWISDDLSLSLTSQTYQPSCPLDRLEVPQLYLTHCNQNELLIFPKFLSGAPKFGHWCHYSINTCNTDLVVDLDFWTFSLKKNQPHIYISYSHLMSHVNSISKTFILYPYCMTLFM